MFVLILIVFFLLMCFTIIGIYIVLFAKREDTLSRLKKYTANEKIDIEISKIENDNNEKPLFKLFGAIGKVLFKNIQLNRIKKKINQADVLMKPEEFLGASLINAVLLVGLSYVISKSIKVSLFFIPVGLIIPDLILRYKKAIILKKIQGQLPEALDIISNGLRAGFSFIQAMEIVINEIPEPISKEFAKVLRDNVFGKSLEEALTNMSERIEDEDLNIVITALIIQRQVGGNLVEILDIISSTIRERIKIKANIKTLTAQGRISGLIVSLLPFIIAIVLSIISPGYLEILFTTFIGKIMLVIGILLQIIGIFILMKLVDVKV